MKRFSSKCLKCSRYCWNCGNCLNKYALFCKESCGAVQPVETDTIKTFPSYLLNNDDYDIDYKTLKNKFLELQRQVHPDLFQNKDQRWQEYAQQQSKILVKAYHTLKDPYSRAVYLLHSLGIETKVKSDDQEFLSRIMEYWEELDEIQDSNVDILLEKVQRIIKETVAHITRGFKEKNYSLVEKKTLELKDDCAQKSRHFGLFTTFWIVHDILDYYQDILDYYQERDHYQERHY